MSERMELIEAVPDKRAELVKGLLEKGIENPEVLKALNVWAAEQERKVEAAGRTPEARINFEIERAKIYAEGDYIDAALDTLYDVLHVAQQEGMTELEKKVREEIAAAEGTE